MNCSFSGKSHAAQSVFLYIYYSEELVNVLFLFISVWSKIKTNKESERWKPDTEVCSQKKKNPLMESKNTVESSLFMGRFGIHYQLMSLNFLQRNG